MRWRLASQRFKVGIYRKTTGTWIYDSLSGTITPTSKDSSDWAWGRSRGDEKRCYMGRTSPMAGKGISNPAVSGAAVQRTAPCNLSPRLGTPPTGSRSLIPCIGGSTRGPRKQGALRCSGGRCDKAHSNNYGTLSCLFPRHAGVRASSTSRLRPAATIAATNSGRCAIIVR